MSFYPTTRRLVLRAPMLADQAAFLSLLNDYDVAKNLSSVPYPYSQAHFLAFLTHCDDAHRAGAARHCAVTRAMDGALIGLCSVRRAQQGAWELGYWLGKPYWRQGYATEAARAVMRYAFEEMAAQRLVAGWFCDNPASGRVLEKLGFESTGVTQSPSLGRGHRVPANRMVLTRAQFARKKAA